MKTTTAKELELIIAIATNEMAEDITSSIWSDNIPGWSNNPSFGGVMASLVKKGLACSDQYGRRSEWTCWLTESGAAIFKTTVEGELPILYPTPSN